MKFLPFDNYRIESNMSYDEVREALRKNIGEKRTFAMMFKTPEEPYSGEMYDNAFKITRNIRYRNSFLPIIRGTFTDSYPGTIIEIKMRLHAFVYVFMTVWFGGVTLALIATLSQAIAMSIMPLGMLIFGYALVMTGYKYEVGKTKKFFVNLFGEQNYMPDVRSPIEDVFDKIIRKDKGAP